MTKRSRRGSCRQDRLCGRGHHSCEWCGRKVHELITWPNDPFSPMAWAVCHLCALNPSESYADYAHDLELRHRTLEEAITS
jgi:hypothetical protein